MNADEDLVHLDGNYIVLRNGAVKKVLALLRTSHAGVNRTYKMALCLYFWPGMLNDVKQLVQSCITCRKYLPSQPVNQRTTPLPSSYMGPPMGHVGVDLFDFGGKKCLVCVDQWSGYPVFSKSELDTYCQHSSSVNWLVSRSWMAALHQVRWWPSV